MPAFWLGGWVWSAVAASQARSPATSAANPADYIGTETCLKCHGQLGRLWQESPHSKYLMAEGLPPELSGCEACHGPGRAHATSRAKRKQIVAWSSLTTEQAKAVCLKCHGPKGGAPLPQTHGPVNLTCNTCHEVHRKTGFDALLRQEQKAACLQCHPQIATATPEEHHVDVGMPCATCHDPHIHTTGMPVKPAREACAQCHGQGGIQPASHKDPNFGTTHGKLALTNMPRCLTCHDKQKDCTSCHGVEMPHPEGYVPFGHAADVTFETQQKCQKCHQPTLCNACHVRDGGQAQ